MTKNNVIPFTEITARAEKLKQQKEVIKKIDELEVKKSKNIEALKYGLENRHFGKETANLLSLLAIAIFADCNILELKAENNNNTTKPKTKGGVVK